jgi:hypothetical protein
MDMLVIAGERCEKLMRDRIKGIVSIPKNWAIEK